MPATNKNAFTEALGLEAMGEEVVNMAPNIAVALASIAAAAALGVLFENSVSQSQQQNTIAMAAVSQGVLQIYSVGTMATANSVVHLEPGSRDADLAGTVGQIYKNAQASKE